MPGLIQCRSGRAARPPESSQRFSGFLDSRVPSLVDIPSPVGVWANSLAEHRACSWMASSEMWVASRRGDLLIGIPGRLLHHKASAPKRCLFFGC